MVCKKKRHVRKQQRGQCYNILDKRCLLPIQLPPGKGIEQGEKEMRRLRIGGKTILLSLLLSLSHLLFVRRILEEPRHLATPRGLGDPCRHRVDGHARDAGRRRRSPPCSVSRIAASHGQGREVAVRLAVRRYRREIAARFREDDHPDARSSGGFVFVGGADARPPAERGRERCLGVDSSHGAS